MNKKRHRSDEEEPYYRNLVVRNIPDRIPDQDVVECLHTEYKKYGRCKVKSAHGSIFERLPQTERNFLGPYG